ncbi:MAG: response regulator [Paenibacillaceae bacterium]|nr:response regulator [Paenibacillaceae bacterium]
MANIMIVDDSPIIRRSLRGIFETLGHRVVAEAEDGSEAVKRYEAREVDLVTMDIQLPGFDGIETVRLLRERNPEAVIVMISSVENRSKVYEAIKLGAKHYIVKPYTEEKVEAVIQAVLGSHPTAQAAKPAPTATAEPAATGRFAKSERADKQREPLELHIPSLQALPFELVLKEGRIVLTVQRYISEMNARTLHACLQGMLYYRKAKYVLDLWEPILYDEGMRLLVDFVAAVRARRGTVGIVTGDAGYFIQLKAKLRDGVYRSYAEIEW